MFHGSQSMAEAATALLLANIQPCQLVAGLCCCCASLLADMIITELLRARW